MAVDVYISTRSLQSHYGSEVALDDFVIDARHRATSKFPVATEGSSVRPRGLVRLLQCVPEFTVTKLLQTGAATSSD